VPVAELPWRTCTQRLSEYETQVECADVNQLPLPNIFPASQIHPPPSGLCRSSGQTTSQSVLPASSAAVCHNCLSHAAGSRIPLAAHPSCPPSSPRPLRFRDIAACLGLPYRQYRLVTVVPLVSHDLSSTLSCAVKRRWFTVGESPTRGSGSLHPVAIGAVVEVTKLLKPSV
jgi:hypothetical protein